MRRPRVDPLWLAMAAATGLYLWLKSLVPLVAGYLTDYAALMETHILKEERFYRVTDSILGGSDHAELKATFDRLDEAALGADGHARYCQWVYQLAGAPG